jgi:hypothetical protein
MEQKFTLSSKHAEMETWLRGRRPRLALADVLAEVLTDMKAWRERRKTSEPPIDVQVKAVAGDMRRFLVRRR